MARNETSPGVDAWVEALVARESQPAVLEGWVERIAVPTLADNPEVGQDPVLARAVRSAIRSHWLAFLGSLNQPPHTVQLVAPAAELAGELARRGHPSTLLFRIYRVAQQAVWDYATTLADTTRDAPADQAQGLVFFWSRASAWLDASIEASVEIFQDEVERMRKGAAAQRLEAVRTILAGTATDTRELSALLGGHPLSGHHTALLLHTEEHEAIADLGSAAKDLARRIGARALVVDPGGRDLWCWLATRSAPDLRLFHGARDWLAERHISVAAGLPGEGVEGFRGSHQEAQAAQRLGFQLVRPAPVVLYGEMELLTLVSGSPEAARRFAVRTLGALADPAETPTRLRQTLHALLSTGSVDEASKVLHVHKNTVRYRVNQAEELLGRKAFDSPTEVELALRYYDLLVVPAD